ncbi:hypothetical protein BK011_08715 [Tenericutes bacterium MZ-XQ]|nr:hypothetical protein BK011_08715 [Tenericutes bacterium MZ-XQ]
MKYYHFKWLYICIFIIVVNKDLTDPINFISDYMEILTVLSLIFIVFMKFVTIERKRVDFGLRFYLMEVVEAFLLFMIMSFILVELGVNLTNAIIIETILFLLIGYFDFFFAKNINQYYPIDKLGMFSVIAIVYILAEIDYFEISNISGLRNSIAFIVFMDIFIMLIFNRFSSFKTKKKKGSTKKFEDYLALSPKKDIIDSPYFDMINYGVNDENIKNIAITSIYGGGKSSIIGSYLNKFNIHDYVNISLAHFDDVTESDNILNILQLKIIKHLFYKVNPSKLMKSSYVKKTMSAKSVGINVVFSYLVYFILVLLLNNNFFDNNLRIDIDNIYFNLLPLFFVFIFLIIKSSPIKIKKVDTKFGTFVMSNLEEESTFDKYIEELIYFFKATEKSIVIIEDIDRYREISIFSALRELNILLNDNENINKKITFIYAVNDYLIEEENKSNRKTKFFDLVIPIIPKSSSYNTSGILSDYLKDNDILFKSIDKQNVKKLSIEPSTEFLDRLSFYITDMRTLKNIVNEYLITLKSINEHQGVSFKNIQNKYYIDKLFAMIVYKNYMPMDYTLLYDNKGLVYTLIKQSQIFKSYKKDELMADLEILQKEKNYLDTFGLSEPLLDQLISQHYRISRPSQEFYIYETEKSTTHIDRYSTSTSNGILGKLKGKYYRENNRGALINFDDSVESILKKGESKWYSVTIKDRNTVASKIHKLQNEISRLENMRLAEMIKSMPSDSIRERYAELSYDIAIKKETIESKESYIKDIKNKIPEILLFLLKNGYIEEDYEIYMNYFVEGRRTESDRRFIQALFSDENLRSDLVLCDFEGILKVMKPDDFRKKVVLNYSLFDYLFDTDNIQILTLLFSDFVDLDRLSFLKEYLLVTTNPEKITIFLLSNYYELLDLLLAKYDDDLELNDILLNYILMYNINKNINVLISTDMKLKLNNFSRILLYNSEIQDQHILDNFKNNLLLLDLKISKLDDSTDNNKLIEYIFQNRLYSLNYDVLRQILQNILNSDVTPTYDVILQNNFNDLKKYVDQEINVFVTDVLIFGDIKRNETSESITELLNNPNLRVDVGISLISCNHVCFSIEKLSDIVNKAFYSDLLVYNRLMKSINNVNTLIEYITANKVVDLNSKLSYYILQNIESIKQPENEMVLKKINKHLPNMFNDDDLVEVSVKKLFDEDIWNLDFIKTASDDELTKVIHYKIIKMSKMTSLLGVMKVLDLIYKASIIDDDFDFDGFKNSVFSMDYQSSINEFVQSLSNEKHRKKLIIGYSAYIDAKYLFNLLPDDIKNDLLSGKHVSVTGKEDWFYLVDIGEQLFWFRKKHKEEKSWKLIPKPSIIKNFV